MKFLKGLGFILGLLAFGGAATYLWARTQLGTHRQKIYNVPPVDLTPFQASVDLELGKRIITVRTGCTDCHGKDLGGNTVINDPVMGRFDAPNITPAKLASWTDGEIARAIRHGIGKKNQPLVLMPSTEFNGMSGADLASAVAYLRSVPAVNRESGPIDIGPLATILIATGKLPTALTAELINHDRPFTDKPAEEPTAAFGAYLAQGCSGCHNPQFTGGPIPGQWNGPAQSLRFGLH